MKLSELIEGLPYERVSGSLQRAVSGIALDSRQVREGYVFVACKGGTTDGHQYIGDAVARGAAAVLCSEGVGALPGHVSVVRMACTAEVLRELARRFYGQPRCKLVGITGTNGKTTTAYLTRYFLERVGWPCGLIGTVVYEFGGRSIPAARTTPDIFELHRLVHQMAGAGARAVAMEVSSHALAQDRVGALEFAVAVFTNLSQDHLDYHHTMEEYYQAKRRLFDHVEGGGVDGGLAVVVVDDDWGRRLAGELGGRGMRVQTVSVGGGAAGVRAEGLQLSAGGCVCDVWWEGRRYEGVRLNLLGRHNVANTLCAMAAARAVSGAEIGELLRYTSELPAAPGRLEFVPNKLGVTVVVDYAHTEDALRNVLQCVREWTRGAVWVVFGCGGDRDRGKRPRMGAVAEELADYVIVTSDNPRTEAPEKIIEEICAGMRRAPYAVQVDRRRAIEQACAGARPGDTVVIAGKGHETYQEINRVFYPFDDRAVAREILAELEAARVHT